MKTKVFTSSDFKTFKQEVERLVGALGLSDWDLSISHEQIGDNCCAQTHYDDTAKIASIRLTIQVEGDYGLEWDPRRLAMHEVLHLLLADFCVTSCKIGDAVDPLVMAQEHAVIHRLMKVLK